MLGKNTLLGKQHLDVFVLHNIILIFNPTREKQANKLI